MKKVAVVYHSGHGHTENMAREVFEGVASVGGVAVDLLKADALSAAPEQLIGYDGFIWGSPTYLGGVSGVFKTFMDATGRLWKHQQLRGRLAAGFTVSSLPAGDKQTTLLSMVVFSMQHGMIWVGNPVMPEQHGGVPYAQAANRLGSWTGMMAQAGHDVPADAFEPGDIRSAKLFGRNFAETLLRTSARAEPALALAEAS